MYFVFVNEAIAIVYLYFCRFNPI